MLPRNRVVLSVCGLLLIGGAIAADKNTARTPVVNAGVSASQPVRLWSAAGGTVDVRWNRDLARDLGIRIAPAQHAADARKNAGDRFALKDAGTLQFRVNNGYFGGFGTGALQARGGYVLELADGPIALTDFRLVPRAASAKSGPSAVTRLDLVGADGQAWFYVDRLMHEMTEQDSVLAVRSSDVRISARLARRLGRAGSRWLDDRGTAAERARAATRQRCDGRGQRHPLARRSGSRAAASTRPTCSCRKSPRNTCAVRDAAARTAADASRSRLPRPCATTSMPAPGRRPFPATRSARAARCGRPASRGTASSRACSRPTTTTSILI